MEHRETLEGWPLVLDAYGTQARAARAAGITQPSLHRAMHSGRRIPAEWARAWHDDRGLELWKMREDLWPEHERR